MKREVELFVVKVSAPFIDLDNIVAPKSDLEWNEAIFFASKQKIIPLFIQGCRKHSLKIPSEAMELLEESFRKYRNRWLSRLKVVGDLVELSEKYDLQLIVFKTLKPFPYDPDDVDILVLDAQDMDILVKELNKRGFVLLKRGTPEITFRKVYPNTYVDLDIHTELSIGYLNLFDKDIIRHEIVYKSLDVNGMTIKAPILSDRLEIVREAAYTLLKDFSLSLSSFYLGIYALKNTDFNTLEPLAKKAALTSILKLYLASIYAATINIFGNQCIRDITFKQVDSYVNIMRLKPPHVIPYMYHPLHIVLAYSMRVMESIINSKKFDVAWQVLRQPSAKGVGIIIQYLENLIAGK